MIAIFDAIHDFLMDVPSHWIAFKRSVILIPILFILLWFDVIRQYGEIPIYALFGVSAWLNLRASQQKRSAR